MRRHRFTTVLLLVTLLAGLVSPVAGWARVGAACERGEAGMPPAADCHEADECAAAGSCALRCGASVVPVLLPLPALASARLAVPAPHASGRPPGGESAPPFRPPRATLSA